MECEVGVKETCGIRTRENEATEPNLYCFLFVTIALLSLFLLFECVFFVSCPGCVFDFNNLNESTTNEGHIATNFETRALHTCLS